MCAYAFGENPVQLWQPHLGAIPAELLEAIRNTDNKLLAWNAGFEREIFDVLLGIKTDYSRWIDPSVYCKHMSMPGALEDCGEILGLPADQAKLKDGKRLIRLFCGPAGMGGEETLFGISEPNFRDWNTDPRDWELFCEYCKQDVVAEREIFKLVLPLPPTEQKGWELDQKINDTGMPTDMQLVGNASKMAIRSRDELLARQKAVTGLENPNSTKQLLEWARNEKYPFNQLDKDHVVMALKNKAISDSCREALKLRQLISKTSDSKLITMAQMVSPDGFLRNQFNYGGAARTFRWSGRDVQVQNLFRPTKDVASKLDLAIELVRNADYDGVIKAFPAAPGDPNRILEVTSSLSRSSFKTPEGWHFVVCDLNAIEPRVIGQVADCSAMKRVFIDKRPDGSNIDCYLDFGVTFYQRPYETITKEERQLLKPAYLSGGYGSGGGDEVINKNGDKVKTGVWGYAERNGVNMTRAEAHKAVAVYREKFHEIPTAWADLDYITHKVIRDRVEMKLRDLTFDMVGNTMRIKLPSGRYLHYINARLEVQTIQGKKGPYEREAMVYDGRMLNGGWGKITTWGGKLIENIVQAIARDILLHGMFLADELGFKIVGMFHDELACLVRNTDKWTLSLDCLADCMSTSPVWYNGPLAAEGYIGENYRKA